MLTSDTLTRIMSDAKAPGLAAMPIETSDNDSTRTKNVMQSKKALWALLGCIVHALDAVARAAGLQVHNNAGSMLE